AAMPTRAAVDLGTRLLIVRAIQNIRRKNIAARADGFDNARLLGVVGQFAPQPADLNIDAAVEGHRLTAARQIQQLIAREDARRMRQESLQDLPFAAGQWHEAILLVAHFARTERRRKPIEADDPIARFLFLDPAAMGPDSPEDRLDARQQLTREERL